MSRIIPIIPMSKKDAAIICGSLTQQPKDQKADRIKALEFNIESIRMELKNGFFASDDDKARKISAMRGMMLDHARLMFA